MRPGFALVLVAAGCASQLGVARVPRQDRFPNPEWATTRNLREADTDASRVKAYHDWLAGRGGAYWAAVVVKNGYLVYQGRGPRGNVRQKNDCGSIKKSLQATVLGTALFQGKLASLDQDALAHWKDPHVTPYENDRRISFRQFAQYRDRWNEPEPPGSYHYNNSSATAAGACIAGLFREVRGPRAPGMTDVARDEVMRRIGADWDLWYWDSDFTAEASNPGPRMVLEASAYELAKLGYLWLRKGRWKNERVFSEEYFREAVTDWSPDSRDERSGYHGHYGYWWFVNSRQILLPSVPADAFYHIGNGSPKRATALLVIPSHDTVAVLSMERISDDGKWDVIQNSRLASNDGPRPWAVEVAKLHAPTDKVAQNPRH